MNVILYDNNRINYYPLSLTRPIAYFRVGILTIKEKWNIYYDSVSVKTESYLATKYPINVLNDNLWINASILPSEELIIELKNLRVGEGLSKNGQVFAFRSNDFDIDKLNIIDSHAQFSVLEKISDIFSLNGQQIKNDMKIMGMLKMEWSGDKKILEDIKDSNIKIGNHPIYIEDGAKLQHSILNTSDGPIYIGKDAEIMEGSMIRGPFAMGQNSVVKMGAKIYGATTLGPYCKVGGELNNVVLFGYSSKSHDGFLGNSVLGEWCNLGAGTNISNLKNNYADVRLWNYSSERFENTALQFCGLIMGDHSKSSINTMFNTGTVVGVSANIFGAGFPRNFIPSFSWGGSKGFMIYKLSKMYNVASKVFSRRGVEFSKIEEDILLEVYNLTKRYRNEV